MRHILVLAMALCGCYSSSPPAGSYRCIENESGNCPTGQLCECGLCVNKHEQAACSLKVTVDQTPTVVAEHEPFGVTVQAFAKDGSPAGGFGGTVPLSATWGDVSPDSLTLEGGVG